MEQHHTNPILTISDVPPSRAGMEVIGVFNAGVARLNGKTILLLRVAERPIDRNNGMVRSVFFDHPSGEWRELEFSKNDPEVDVSDSRWITAKEKKYITSISHFRVAISENNVDFEVRDDPAMQAENGYECYGIEDPRITQIDDEYWITYSAVSDKGITDCLAVTKDFKTFTRRGVIFLPDNKDVVLFPEKIKGEYYALCRPSSSVFGTPDIWIASSLDLCRWGNYRHLMGTRAGCWDDGRIGGGTVPIRTPQGWLELYHGASKADEYCMGAVLFDLTTPSKVVARSSEPLLRPEAVYEKEGFFGGVVFSCGMWQEGDMLHIYYGAADCCICYATMQISAILEQLQ